MNWPFCKNYKFHSIPFITTLRQASAKPMESSIDVESPGSSNSSSSESDSDLDDVDKEVEELNASLIEQTSAQNKELNVRPESSSSFNLCKYIHSRWHTSMDHSPLDKLLN